MMYSSVVINGDRQRNMSHLMSLCWRPRSLPARLWASWLPFSGAATCWRLSIEGLVADELRDRPAGT